MDAESLKLALSRLNLEKAQVVYWKCVRQRLTDEQIADKIILETGERGRSGNWVYQQTKALLDAFRMLGIDGFTDEVCDAINELADLLPDDNRGAPDWTAWPPQIFSETPASVDEPRQEPMPYADTNDREIEGADTLPSEVSTPEPNGRSIWHWIVAGAAALILLAAGFFLNDILPQTEPEPTAAALLDSEPTQPLQTTDVPTQAVQVTEEPDPDVAVVPTSIVQTVQSSLTTEPTLTPEPTPTPEPTSSVFVEDFNDAEFEPWITFSDTPIIVNGVLQDMPGDIQIEIGDETWRNYSIEFQFIKGGSTDNRNRLGVRVQDMNNMVYMNFSSANAWWHLLEDGQVTRLGNLLNSSHRLKVVVVDSRLQMFVGNNSRFDYPSVPFETGGAIYTHYDTSVDWIEVEILD